MQEALPYKRWDAPPPVPAAASPPTTTAFGSPTVVESLIKGNPVIVIGKRGCFMCHVVRKLLLGLGVNPPIFEIDGDDDLSKGMLVNALISNENKIGEISSNNNNNNKNKDSSYEGKLQFPLVFVGGKLFGGLDKVMATHLSGELVPILKQAGALWL